MEHAQAGGIIASGCTPLLWWVLVAFVGEGYLLTRTQPSGRGSKGWVQTRRGEGSGVGWRGPSCSPVRGRVCRASGMQTAPVLAACTATRLMSRQQFHRPPTGVPHGETRLATLPISGRLLTQSNRNAGEHGEIVEKRQAECFWMCILTIKRFTIIVF